MKSPEKYKNEKERLKILESYSILDTLPESDYDNLTAIASEICNMRISLISLLDNDRQWFKSHHGLDTTETSKDFAFCAHAINESSNVFVVPDARKDERFYDNPLVTGDPNVIFYAGVPLNSPEGFPLGTLCVIDNKPNLLSQSQLNSLKALANQAMNLLELRKNKIQLQQVIEELKESNTELEKFAHIAAHDLKSPLNNISALSKFLSEHYSSKIDEEGQEIIGFIGSSAEKLRSLIEGLLNYSKSDRSNKETKTEINLKTLTSDVAGLFSFGDKCRLILKTESEYLYANRTAIEQILINLVANANKYNDKPITVIELSVKESETEYEISVKDNGPGILKEHQQRIFQIFETLSNEDKFGEQGNGIGLAIVKKLVEILGGKIRVVSEIGKGAEFIFNISK